MQLKQFLTVISLLIFGAASPVVANPAEDAAYIVEQHLVFINYEEKVALMSQDIVTTMQTGFDNFGAEIIDPDKFLDVLLGDFFSEFMVKVQADTVVVFQETLSPEELAALAGFYRSDEGQALLVQGDALLALSIIEGHPGPTNQFFQTGSGAAILARMPELLAGMNGMFQAVQVRLNELFTLDRIADIMEMKSVVRFKDESQRQVVVDALRKPQ